MQDADAEGLRFHTDGAVAVVTIDNEQEENRLTDGAIARFASIADGLRAREDLHVLVVCGAGRDYFCTGILNPVIRGRMGKDDVIALVLRTAALFDAIESLPQVVIAGINGVMRAGGVELALACDIRVATAHARLAMPEAKWGGFPGAGGPLRLARLVGRARALELVCTGREVDAGEMQTLGLVQKVAPEADFDRILWTLVRDIALSGPLAIRGAKAIMRTAEEAGASAAGKFAVELRRKLEWSVDVDEGIRAHREGRQPKFTGR